jgi:hypothetical protein
MGVFSNIVVGHVLDKKTFNNIFEVFCDKNGEPCSKVLNNDKQNDDDKQMDDEEQMDYIEKGEYITKSLSKFGYNFEATLCGDECSDFILVYNNIKSDLSATNSWCKNDYCCDHESIFSLDLIVKKNEKIKKDFKKLNDFLNLQNCELFPQIIGCGGRC